MKKYRIKQAFQWVLALTAGFLLVNALCMVYERPAGWLDTEQGAATSVWRPGAVLIHGTEGYSISRVDENGYLNPTGTLENRYVLMMGASHTQGKEVSPEQRYSALVNDYFRSGSETLAVYNIACDGHFLPTQIRHFSAAVEAFPGAGVITIEIGSTDFSPEELHGSLNQVKYGPEDTARRFASLGTVGKLKLAAKEGLPLLSLVKKNLETLRAGGVPDEGSASRWDGYEAEMDAALALIRSEFDGPIAFVYHPSVTLLPDGTMRLFYSDTWEIFCGLCEQNGIDVIDTGPRFLACYEGEHRLPYGFANTAPGSGHLNAVGHRIVAEEIISYLEELRV